jgi:2-dehydro-3-deoxyphosphooctonate aldolase (KDO 8-P synthase)
LSNCKDRFFLIAGPCIIEDEDTSFLIAREVKNICIKLDIPYIFKASYKKANRTRLDSFTGIGDQKALEIIQRIGKDLDLPVITDIHESKDADMAAPYVDALQIPAFLSRQTDLLVAAARTGKVINIKKAQFSAPSAMEFPIQKVKESGNNNIWITERGTSFGYQNLIVDFTGFPVLTSFNVPLILDCTHSLQIPNQDSGITGGKPEYIETLAKAGIAAGADGLFMETHPKPSLSKSDGANMLALNQLENLLKKLVLIKKAID